METAFGILLGLILVAVFFIVGWPFALAFWRLVDRIFGWGEFDPKRNRQTAGEKPDCADDETRRGPF